MTIYQTGLSPTEHETWSRLVSQGISRSVAGLMEMVGTEVVITRLDPPRRIAMKDVPDLIGGAEAMTVAVYLRVSGCATGHMLLVFQPETAFELVDMLLDLAPGTTTDLGDMERSAIGEMGNIMGSFFLNALADSTNLPLMPSPPAVMMDMAGSILNSALVEIFMVSEDLLVVDTVFGTKDRQLNGTFLMMPSEDLVTAMVKREPAS